MIPFCSTSHYYTLHREKTLMYISYFYYRISCIKPYKNNNWNHFWLSFTILINIHFNIAISFRFRDLNKPVFLKIFFVTDFYYSSLLLRCMLGKGIWSIIKVILYQSRLIVFFLLKLCIVINWGSHDQISQSVATFKSKNYCMVCVSVNVL